MPSYFSADNDGEISDINVTPFVDVLLVLLIIFMITAPIITKSIEINLPEEKLEQVVNKRLFDFIIDVDKKKNLYYLEKKITFKDLEKKLKDFSISGGKEIFIRADKELAYGEITKIMTFVKNLDINNIGLLVKEK